MIRFENVRKEFGEHVALHNINFEVKEGELVCLIGPSGCGKTTCLKMINRLIELTSGSIHMNEKDIAEHDPVELRRNVGYVIQQIGLFPHLSIAKNIALVPKLKGWKADRYKKRTDELLQMVGLDPDTYRDRFPSELSGGQQQRIGVIRALAAEPPIVLMDEPFSALDPISREQLQEEMMRLQEEIKKTIVFVTHDMDEALKIADRIAIMVDGHIIQFDTPHNILKNPKDAFVRDFIGEKRLGEAIDEEGFERQVNHVMSQPKKVLQSDYTVSQARDLLGDTTPSLLPVVNKDNELEGLVSSTELYIHLEDDQLVASLMVTDFTRLGPEENWKQALKHLLGEGAQAMLPVVTSENKLHGVVTEKTILRCLTAKEKIVVK
ncbi:betaine/proline/choline family ABC transporter ATP-binding protein [Thalassobacillus sp. CUG 92003]|uniref:betaine/proline/choline family ABC transporter ATP-binding protein n=1 Tax=Thalassobacillus sp. CUG 92003 TaxID=2736641 RepID=UPI0015E724FC|nr:betaine/proline/choline family ABC transporter ATP-binding protein [Thalassobacillus sp. CUG 92003]